MSDGVFEAWSYFVRGWIKVHNNLPQSGAVISKNTGDLLKLHRYNLAKQAKLYNLLLQEQTCVGFSEHL